MDIRITKQHDRATIEALTWKGHKWLADNIDNTNLVRTITISSDLIKDFSQDLMMQGLKVDVL